MSGLVKWGSATGCDDGGDPLATTSEGFTPVLIHKPVRRRRRPNRLARGSGATRSPASRLAARYRRARSGIERSTSLRISLFRPLDLGVRLSSDVQEGRRTMAPPLHAVLCRANQPSRKERHRRRPAGRHSTHGVARGIELQARKDVSRSHVLPQTAESDSRHQRTATDSQVADSRNVAQTQDFLNDHTRSRRGVPAYPR
jgi:hypothetical protein